MDGKDHEHQCDKHTHFFDFTFFIIKLENIILVCVKAYYIKVLLQNRVINKNETVALFIFWHNLQWRFDWIIMKVISG